MLEAFFAAIDAEWSGPPGAKRPLRIIGSAAVMLQTDYRRYTKDGDVLETVDLPVDVRQQLKTLAGKDSALHRTTGLFLDVVPNGLPFLPHGPLWHALPIISARLQHFDLLALDLVDVAVTKLKRFHGNDRNDIKMLVERQLIPHDKFLARFLSAVDELAHDARANELPAVIRNFHTVERDMLLVPASEIPLPSWL